MFHPAALPSSAPRLVVLVALALFLAGCGDSAADSAAHSAVDTVGDSAAADNPAPPAAAPPRAESPSDPASARTPPAPVVPAPVSLPTVELPAVRLPPVDLAPRLELDLTDGAWTLWLDDEAAWIDDELHLPGADVAGLPARPPTPGWEVLVDSGRAVTVPSTVETWTWDERGDHRGVSWWHTTFTAPASASGRSVRLAFASVRLRAEVFLDRELLGYDAVGGTPFEVDISDRVRPGELHELAVRVTDPGGNFDWIDHTAHWWGRQRIPPSHGFGGITGPVRLVVTDAVHVADIAVFNTERPDTVEVEVQVRNDGPAEARRHLMLSLATAENPARPFPVSFTADVTCPPGTATVLRQKVRVGDAALWTLDDPRLHLARVDLRASFDGPVLDRAAQRFGFRSFTLDGVGDDAIFRLNGRRVFLLSAISWGFWPVTGSVPLPGLPGQQVHAARALGLNMLNHHRNRAAPGLLDVQDELGLLAYEEPGGYWCQEGDALTFALAREKWLRVVKRDRSHPSLVLLNMINEATVEPDERMLADLRAAQALDPSRTITFTSAWGDRAGPGGKTHVRPYDEALHVVGWEDWHDAPGPGVDRDGFYVSPGDYRRFSEVRDEIVFWGEEGAIGMPPRLDEIGVRVETRDRTGQPRGWDGADALARRDAYAALLARPAWRSAFPSLGHMLRSLGDVSYAFHRRAIQNVRLGDVTDGYVINGWEGERFENHSGIVGPWRLPKGSPDRIAETMEPRQLLVRLPQRIAQASFSPRPGARTMVTMRPDVFLVDETELEGPAVLRVRWLAPDGTALAEEQHAVSVTGGDVFGQLLRDDFELRVDAPPGRQLIEAELLTPDGSLLAQGAEDLFLVDWRSRDVPDGGALLESGGRLDGYLRIVKGVDVPSLAEALPATPPVAADGLTQLPAHGLADAGPLRWIAVAGLDPEPREIVPREALRPPAGLDVPRTRHDGSEHPLDAEGNVTGILAQYFAHADLSGHGVSRLDPNVDLASAVTGPARGIGGLEYGVRWIGRLVPPETGPYRFQLVSAGGVRLWIDDELVLDAWDDDTEGFRASRLVGLGAGREVDLRVEHRHSGAHRRVTLYWTRPSQAAPGRAVARELLRRVEQDGTSLLVLDRTDAWARVLAESGGPACEGTLPMGRYWMGGGYLARAHPLLAGLPVNGALNWEYQELVHYGAVRDGVLFGPEVETVVACVSDHQAAVGTALGLGRHGAGRVIYCTLDVVTGLDTPPGPGDVPRLLFANLLDVAAGDG